MSRLRDLLLGPGMQLFRIAVFVKEPRVVETYSKHWNCRWSGYAGVLKVVARSAAAAEEQAMAWALEVIGARA